MGGYGSGRNGGRPTVESAVRLDIANLMCRGAIQLGTHLRGSMRFDFFYRIRIQRGRQRGDLAASKIRYYRLLVR
jgi:hypothetical protein